MSYCLPTTQSSAAALSPVHRALCAVANRVAANPGAAGAAGQPGTPSSGMFVTYRVELVLGPKTLTVQSMFGDQHPIQFPPAWQAAPPFAANFGGVMPIFYAPTTCQASATCNLQFDSWLSLGSTDGSQKSNLAAVLLNFAAWSTNNPLQGTLHPPPPPPPPGTPPPPPTPPHMEGYLMYDDVHLSSPCFATDHLPAVAPACTTVAGSAGSDGCAPGRPCFCDQGTPRTMPLEVKSTFQHPCLSGPQADGQLASPFYTTPTTAPVYGALTGQVYNPATGERSVVIAQLTIDASRGAQTAQFNVNGAWQPATAAPVVPQGLR